MSAACYLFLLIDASSPSLPFDPWFVFCSITFQTQIVHAWRRKKQRRMMRDGGFMKKNACGSCTRPGSWIEAARSEKREQREERSRASLKCRWRGSCSSRPPRTTSDWLDSPNGSFEFGHVSLRARSAAGLGLGALGSVRAHLRVSDPSVEVR